MRPNLVVDVHSALAVTPYNRKTGETLHAGLNHGWTQRDGAATEALNTLKGLNRLNEWESGTEQEGTEGTNDEGGGKVVNHEIH